MPEIDNKAQWPGWTTTRLIGRGSFGAVYEIERDVFGHVEKAALKHMTIPQNEGDVDELRDSGYDDESITATFKSHIESIVSEYSLMRSMNGSSNIVNCDDFSIMPRDNGIGWDILIKMELLTPLTKAIHGRADEEQAQKLANDMCSALMLCKKHNIIHRDIKPQNIFVSTNGDYKLGDFGIAKTMERTTGGTKIGTYKYMAPEVYNNRPYNQTADIYSLGLVLHWLLNEKRAPFMPLPPEIPKATDEEIARQRRFAGEALPAPKNGSDELKRIVLKACAFNPQDRYQSAQEMKGDLKALEFSEYTVGKGNTSPETENKEKPEPTPIKQAPQAQPRPEEDATMGAWQRTAPVEDSDTTAGAWQRPEPVEDSDATVGAWRIPEPVENSDATVGVWHKPEPQKTEGSKEMPKKKSKWWIWLVAAVLAVSVVISLAKLISPTINSRSVYNEAMALKSKGKYEQASHKFITVIDYSDSEKQYLECVYIYATELEEDGEYKAAIKAYGALNGYLDSEKRINKCREYLRAESTDSVAEASATGETIPSPDETPNAVPDVAPDEAPTIASGEKMPSLDEIMSKMQSVVKRPKDSSMLSKPVKMYVMSKYGTLMYIQKEPSKSAGSIDEALEASIVTVYAVEDGFCLGIIEDSGKGGWFDKALLSEKYYSGPNPNDTTNLEKNVQRPVKADYLDSYEVQYVKTKHGNRANMLRVPDPDESGNTFAYVDEGAEVTVLARRGNYSFIISDTGRKGWVSSKLLVSNY